MIHLDDDLDGSGAIHNDFRDFLKAHKIILAFYISQFQVKEQKQQPAMMRNPQRQMPLMEMTKVVKK
jgi:hypothetical protein